MSASKFTTHKTNHKMLNLGNLQNIKDFCKQVWIWNVLKRSFCAIIKPLHYVKVEKLAKKCATLKKISPWMLMLKVPNFKQRYLNSPKMEICENIWKYWGKVGGKFQKSWRGWLIKSRLVSKNPFRRLDFFCKMVIFIIPPHYPNFF